MAPTETDYLEAVLNANVYDVAIETPLQEAPLLSQRLGNRLFLKREDLQPVFSFKRLGTAATIVMPVTTPQIKIDSVAALGASVVLEGDSYDDAYAEAMRIGRS